MILREVPGTNGKYAAGSDGHIYCYSDARVNARKPKPFQVSEFLGSIGYPCFALITSRKVTTAVHSVVCLAFHGEAPGPEHIVCHYDGNKLNNAPSNLRWGTYSENEADKRRHGNSATGERHGAAKLSDEAVRILRVAIPQGLWDVSSAARVFSVDPSVIRNAVSGKTWRHIR